MSEPGEPVPAAREAEAVPGTGRPVQFRLKTLLLAVGAWAVLLALLSALPWELHLLILQVAVFAAALLGLRLIDRRRPLTVALMLMVIMLGVILSLALAAMLPYIFGAPS